MKRRSVLRLGASVCAFSLVPGGGRSAAQSTNDRMVRIAELQIDPEQLESYKAVLAEEIDASLRVEAGVLQLEAVSLKEDPTQIRILEVYASAESYQAHLLSPHFKKYKAASEGMVKSLKLYEAEPIRVGTPK